MEQMEQGKNCYEGMFLLDAGQPNLETALEPVRTVLARSEAEILSLKPWDERRLAYEIQGRKRGLYVLSYFKLDSDKVVELEHDCLLNENIIRMMVLRRETITEAQIEAPTPAETAPADTSERTGDDETPKNAVSEEEEELQENSNESEDSDDENINDVDDKSID
jgi:small subunit ribosomal protein S6